MSRRKAGSLKPRTVITSIVVCGAICLAGLGYVWSKMQVWGLSRQVKQLELRRDELKRGNDALQRTYAAMCTLERLAARAKELQLGLAAPTPDQMVRVPDPSPVPQPQNSDRFYAVRQTE